MTEQDLADRAYNKIVSPTGQNRRIKYAQLRNGDIVQLNPLGPCFGGQILPINSKLAPMDVNVVAAWLGDDKKVLWRRPPKPPQSKPNSVAPPPPPSKQSQTKLPAKSTPTPPPPPLPPSRSSKTRSTPTPPPPPPRTKKVSEGHVIYTKIAEGKATTEDFNNLIQESTPESVRDRVRRRMKTNATDSHQDEDGHQQLNLPDINKRVQPKRKPAGRSQMNGRGRLAHRHSARTQERTMAQSFAEAVEFIKTNIGEIDYEDRLELVEDKRALGLLATRMMSIPNINRDWLFQIISKCYK